MAAKDVVGIAVVAVFVDVAGIAVVRVFVDVVGIAAVEVFGDAANDSDTILKIKFSLKIVIHLLLFLTFFYEQL
jgi:hypothetical protein